MRNPLYAFVALLVVEGMVAAGFINRENADEARLQLEEVLFYIALLGAALLGFHKYIDAHKHQVSKDAEVVKNGLIVEASVKRLDPPMPIFTEGNGGTPPPSPTPTDEQNIRTTAPLPQ